jgi:peroxiredoxin
MFCIVGLYELHCKVFEISHVGVLSDPTKQTATAYGVLSERGVANRWTFYIGKDGKIVAIDKA